MTLKLFKFLIMSFVSSWIYVTAGPASAGTKIWTAPFNCMVIGVNLCLNQSSAAVGTQLCGGLFGSAPTYIDMAARTMEKYQVWAYLDGILAAADTQSINLAIFVPLKILRPAGSQLVAAACAGSVTVGVTALLFIESLP
jgi:hypothetical protein